MKVGTYKIILLGIMKKANLKILTCIFFLCGYMLCMKLIDTGWSKYMYLYSIMCKHNVYRIVFF
jgi:hypothetical protein